MSSQTRWRRLLTGGSVLALVAGTLSLLIIWSGGQSATVLWVSAWLRTASVALLAVVFLGVLVVGLRDDRQADLYQMAAEITALRETVQALNTQADVSGVLASFSAQLDALEAMIVALEDALQDRL